MDRFDYTFNKIIEEIPYIEYKGVFDFELEKRQSVEEFIDFLNRIFDGEEVKDKYTTKMELDTDERKMYFLSNFMKDPQIKLWISKRSDEDRHKIDQYLKTLAIKFRASAPRSRYY